jgi:hypothetical protein
MITLDKQPVATNNWRMQLIMAAVSSGILRLGVAAVSVA